MGMIYGYHLFHRSRGRSISHKMKHYMHKMRDKLHLNTKKNRGRRTVLPKTLRTPIDLQLLGNRAPFDFDVYNYDDQLLTKESIGADDVMFLIQKQQQEQEISERRLPLPESLQLFDEPELEGDVRRSAFDTHSRRKEALTISTDISTPSSSVLSREAVYDTTSTKEKYTFHLMHNFENCKIKNRFTPMETSLINIDEIL